MDVLSVTTKMWHFCNLWERLRQEMDAVPARLYLWAFGCGVCVEVASQWFQTHMWPPSSLQCLMHTLHLSTDSIARSSTVRTRGPSPVSGFILSPVLGALCFLHMWPWSHLGLALPLQLYKFPEIECETFYIPMQYGNHHPNINLVIKALKGVSTVNNRCWGKMHVEFLISLE